MRTSLLLFLTLLMPQAVRVSGTVSLAADAFDNVSVAKVMFYLRQDSGPSWERQFRFIGEDTTEPYSIDFDSRPYRGNYTVRAVAVDTSGNVSEPDEGRIQVRN